MEETSLKEIALIIKKRLAIIIVLAFGAALISGLVTHYLITPIYQSNSQFLVNKNQEHINSTVELNEIRTNVELINTYSDIIKSNRILDEVIDQLDLTLTSSALSGKLTVKNENNSQVVTVSATDPDPVMAVDLANTTVEVFQSQISELMNVDNVHILNAAVLPANPAPISPNLALNVMIAFVLGAMTGVGLAFLFEYLDTTFKSEEEIEQVLQLPVIGIVSTIQERDLVNPLKQSMSRTNREGRA